MLDLIINLCVSIIKQMLNRFTEVASYQMMFGLPSTAAMAGIIDLHNYICFYLCFVLGLVFFCLYYVLYYSFSKANGVSLLSSMSSSFALRISYFNIIRRPSSKLLGQVSHCTFLEICWIILPTIVLILIAQPSLSLLYWYDSTLLFGRENILVVKIIGHQWYWTYEYVALQSLDTELRSAISLLYNLSSKDEALSFTFDSYLSESIKYYLLEVDKRLVLLKNLPTRLLITSTDVIHSWAIPSFGVKMDACVGRINQVFITPLLSGVFRGACSELCGLGHGFMPIVVVVI